MLERSQVWFATLLGYNHRLVLAHQDFLELWRENEVEIERIVPSMTQYRLYVPTLMVRWFQLRVVRWMDQQWLSSRKYQMFDVEKLFDRIEYQEPWEPRLPWEYEEQLNHSGPKKGGPGGGGGGGKDPNNVPVSNPGWKSALFSSYKAVSRSIRNVLKSAKEDPPPPCPFDAKVEMCLAYHVKGQCNGACKRAADHRPHTDEQDAKLVAWCKKHYK